MDKQTKEEMKANCFSHHKNDGGMMGGAYGLAFIGAAVYFINNADGFWMIVLAVLKAIIWPAFLIYKVFTLLGI